MQWNEEVQIIQRRCDEPLFTMNGSDSGGLNKIPNQQQVKTLFNMGFQHIHKSKHIIASAWPRVLLGPGYPFFNQKA